MQDDEEGWIAEFEAAGESELRDRLYRGSGMHPEAKFHLAVRWLREQARARRLQEEQMRRDGEIRPEITEGNPLRTPVRAGKRSVYYPVKYIYPPNSSTQNAHGFD